MRVYPERIASKKTILTKIGNLSKVFYFCFSIMTFTAPASPDDIIQQEILKAAIQLYQKFGPNGFTMDDLAAATGRSRTSLYYYYKNRDEIYQAVMDKIARDMAAEMRAAVAAVETVGDKIFAFCHTKLKTSKQWGKVFSAMWEVMDAEEQSKHTKVMYSWHKKLIHYESMILNEILADATRRKEIRVVAPTDQDVLVFLIYSGIRGFRREIFELNDPHDLKAALQLLTDMVVKWLKD
jgi:AcrR family transcriptional regulator